MRWRPPAASGPMATQGPRYFGFVVGGSFPVATAADWLVSAWDQNCGIFALSPLVSVVEQAVASWVLDVGGPAGDLERRIRDRLSDGELHGADRGAPPRPRRRGLGRRGTGDSTARPKSTCSSVRKRTTRSSRHCVCSGSAPSACIACPRTRRAGCAPTSSPAPLSRGSGPCIVCAQAGNVNTGAFDPIDAVATAARARGAWLHVDGAFGFWAAASPSLRALVHGIERADSIATDAHKWLNVPYDSGIVLTAHPQSHRRAMTVLAAYIVDNPDERDPHEFVPEESRRGRAVPVYAVLRALGRDGLRALIERNCAQARRMADRLRPAPVIAHPERRSAESGAGPRR